MIGKVTTSLVVLLAAAVGAQAALVGTVDYSDSFTLTANRIDGVYPVGATGRVVENAHGNSAVSWSQDAWAFTTDATHYSGSGNVWTGGNGRGSDTGFVQTGASSGHWGLYYTKPDGLTPLRDSFVVQLDATLMSDWVAITSKTHADGTVHSAGSLSVLFRRSGDAGGICIFKPEIGLTKVADAPATGWDLGTWHNLAVEFAPTTMKIYGDESLLAELDLTNIGGLNYTGYEHTSIGTGFSTLGEWTVESVDNFVVGASIPEPTTMGLLAVGALATLRRKRR